MNTFKRSNRKRGFSLAEVLIVVAVIGILLAVAVPNIIAYYRELKLVELDDSARTIFMAAQNEISAILAADKKGVPVAAPEQRGSCEYPAPVTGGTGPTVDFDYLSTKDNPDVIQKIVPAGSIESELQGNNYIIEYNHETGAVHAVWYWEKGTNFNSYKKDYFNGTDNEKTARINVPVGYYGGGEVDRIAVKQMPIPKLTLINAEELRLDLNVPLNGTSGIDNSKIRVDITISDSEGHEKTIITGAGLDTTDANNPKGSLVLDTLMPGGKNAISTDGEALIGIENKFKNWVAASDITPGDNITVSVKLYYNGTVGTGDDARALLPQVASVKTNSLFANVTDGGVAEIAYGRHLQNLHDSGRGTDYCSGVLANTLITKAVQTKDINFWVQNSADPIQSWASTYPDTDEDRIRNFHPINNTNITEYNGSHDGQRYEIRNINVGPSGTAGLFSFVFNGSLNNITMINPTVHADGKNSTIGTLVATAINVNISGCRVYNEYISGKDPDTVEAIFKDDFILDSLKISENPTTHEKYAAELLGRPHIGAPEDDCRCGGLIGIANSTIKVSDSYISAIIVGSQQVGGLIATADGTVSIDRTYSGSFLLGNRQVGGFIAHASGSVTISDSYCVGEIKSNYYDGFIGAGFFIAQNASDPHSSTNSYAAVRYVDVTGEVHNGSGLTSDPVGMVYGTFEGDTSMSSYFLPQSGVKYQENSGIKLSSAGELQQMVEDGVGSGSTAWNTGTGVTNSQSDTHAYNLLDATKDLGKTEAYPYPMLKNGGKVVPHYGDWLEDVVVEGVMLAYIEKYTDGSYKIYAAKASNASGTGATDVKNTLKDEIVVDDFYRLLSPIKLDLNNWKFTLDGDTTEYELTEDSTTTIELGGVPYYCYTLEKASNWGDEINYYHKIIFETRKKAFIYNPSFACEAFDVSEFEYPDVGGTVTTVDTTAIRSKPGMSGAHDATDVFIRSARQLANIQAYTTATDAPKDTATGTVYGQTWTYDQLANIDFSGTNKYTGSGLTVGKESSAPLTPAKLTTGSYYGHEKEIKNLYIGVGTTATDGAGLFENVGTGGTLDGVRLVNVSVAGGVAKATGGLVGILHGTVNNCGIYVSGATEYSNWTVTGASADGAVGGVGGLIGQISGGWAKLSFAAVKVNGTGADGTGIGPVGGFVGQISDNGEVENCYAGGYVNADKKYGPGTVNVTGGGSVGGFVGNVAESSKFVGINYSTASVCGPTGTVGLFAGAITGATKPTVNGTLYAIAAAFDSTTNSSTAPRDESAYLGGTGIVRDKNETGEHFDEFHYNMGDAVYPYEVAVGQTEHHGDWIVVEVMGLYYDTVGTTTGYYANGNKVTGLDALVNGTPGDKNYATDDGYMFVTKDDLGTITIRVGGKSFQMNPVELTTAMEINGKEYNYKYEVPAEALNTPTDHYYTAVSINGRIFYANFGMACEIFDKVTGLDTPMAKTGITGLSTDPYTGIVVRSARQLANIGIRSNVGEYDTTNTKVYTKEAEAIQKAAISQVLDIDYAEYTATYEVTTSTGTINVSKIPEAVVLDGSNTNANHTPITINGGSYDGHSYEIRNLVPGMIRQITIPSGNSASEVQIQSGLVGRITGGKIENVTLINATVENNAKKAVEASTGTTSGGGSGGTTGKWDPAGDEIHTLQGTDWINGSGVSVPGKNHNTTNNALDGTTYAVTNNDLEFTIKWASKNARFYYLNNKVEYNGLSTEYRMYFGGGATSDGEYVSFKIENPATIKIWWQAPDTNRTISVYNDIDNKKEVGKSPNASSANENCYYDLEVEAGTYYIGSTSSGNNIYRIDVIEHTKENATTPGTTTPDPGKDNFPAGVDSDKFKVRFGALVGAVNPENKTPDEVTITNCGVYVVPDGGTDTAAYTTAYNQYSVKNTATTGFKEDTVGGLIGMATQGTTIEKCYAAVKVAGEYSVGGFIGHLKNAEVKDCYSGGHTVDGAYSTTDYNVTARNGDKGYAGGFAGKIENTDVHNNLKFEGVIYSTASAKGGAKAGNFAGDIPALTATPAWDGFGTARVYGIGAIAGPVITDERVYLDSTVTMHAYNAADLVPAEPYDDVLRDEMTGEATYPYIKTDGQTVHHGDWPMRYNLIYYELYDTPSTDFVATKGDPDTGKKEWKSRDMILNSDDKNNLGNVASYMGFYGTFPDAGSSGIGRVVNTLRVDGTVYDSGYMVVSDRNVESILMTINSYYVNNEDKENNPGVTFDENNQPLHATTVKTSVKIDFKDYKIPIGSSSDTTDVAAELIGKFGYIIPAEGLLLPAASQSFYLDTKINGQTYIFNPQFPCEAINVKIDHLVNGRYEINYDEIRTKPGINYVKKFEDGTTQLFVDKEVSDLIIRTPANLAGMTRFSRPSNNGLVKDKIINYDFVQHMEVDYAKYAPNHVYDGFTPNRSDAKKDSNKKDVLDEFGNKQYEWYKTGQKDYGQVPAVLDSGTYDGMGHTIKNLYLQNDNSSSQYVGLFGQLRNGAKVSNLIMENIHMTANGMGSDDIHVDDAQMNAGALAAVVTDSTVENVTINGVEISFTDEKYATGTKNGKTTYSGLWFEGVGGAIGKITGKAPAGAEASASVTNLKVTTPKISVTIENKNHEKQLNVGGAIGKITGGEATGTTPSVSVTNVTVTDPTITVKADSGDTFNAGTKVGGVIGSADGEYSTYSATATEDNRPVSITESGVYMSKDADGNLNKEFDKSGVIVSGSKLSGDEVGGFAGFLGKGVYLSEDKTTPSPTDPKPKTGVFAAIHVQGKSLVGGFAGHIQGSHVENCYSGGYTVGGKYSDTSYNVVANTSNGTAGGFAGEIDVAYQSGSSGPMAMYMTGVNYSTSSVSGKTVGKFAGKFDGAKALNEKMGDKTPVNYAGGDTKGTLTTESTVNTGAGMPRQKHDAQFKTLPYDGTLTDPFPYRSELTVHHGDWTETPLVGAGYWQVENDKLMVWFVAKDGTENTLHELGSKDFDHDGRDHTAITDSGYFTVAETGNTFTVGSMVDADSDITSRINKLFGEDSGLTVNVYKLATSGSAAPQEWTCGSDTFYVNPAYAEAVELKGSAADYKMGKTEKDAYKIRTVQQLANMGGATSGTYFQQDHDIVFMAGDSYTSATNFQGDFNGGFYRILDITSPVFDTLADGAKIHNVIVYAPEGYTSKTISGNGGLANSTSGTVNVENTIVAGFTINGGSGSVGGLVGEVKDGELTVKNSEATNKLSGGNVGGLVGNVASGAKLTIEKSYAGGEINGTASAGGLVGAADASATVTYENVYSYAKIEGAGTVYGIGPGKVSTKSMLQEYWAKGIPSGKTASDDKSITGWSQLQLQRDTRAFNCSVEELVKPDSVRTKGLENLAAGATDKFSLFPYAAFVTDADGNNYHYGEVPAEMKYAGLFYWEKEVIHYADGRPDDTEYHYYAYGGEIQGTEISAQKLLDTLCYDHHLNGERASITESGYGVFSTDGVTFDKATIDGTETPSTNGLFVSINSSNDIYKKLVEALHLSNVASEVNVYTINTASTSYKNQTWKKVTFKDGTDTLTIDASVNTAFGAAIDQKVGDGGMGDDKGTVPVQIRTMQQFQNLITADKTDNTVEYFAVTHDLEGKDFDDANTASPNGYIPGELKSNVLKGNGYRIFDLNIHTTTGDAALFTDLKSSGTSSSLSGIILYSTDGKGTITAESGNAAGIVANPGKVPVSNCVVAGYTITGSGYVGGIVGDPGDNAAKISNCQVADVTITGGSGAGGIAGLGRGTIENCYAGGTVKASKNNAIVGGIYGGVSGTPTVTGCYSYVDLLTTGASSGNVYAIGKSATVTGSYYLSDFATGAVTTSQGDGKSFEEMMAAKGSSSAKYVYVPVNDTADTNKVKGLVSWGDMYPFAATVKIEVKAGVDKGENTGTVTVHYGAWPEVAGIAQWEVDKDGKYQVSIVGVDLMGNKLADTLIKTPADNNVAASGYAVFTTTGKALTITGYPTLKDGESELNGNDKTKVLEAINKALSEAGVYGVCNSDLSKVYDNKDLVGAIDAKATVTTVDSNPMGKKSVELFYNPGTNGIGYAAYNKANAIKIRTAAELDGIPNSDTSGYTFNQTCDIDGKDYKDYTGATGFAGEYDGQGHMILDLSMTGAANADVGLFAEIHSSAKLRNIIMYAPNGATITGTGSQNGENATNDHCGVGGLVGSIGSGSNDGKATIANCVVAGYTIKGEQYVGGIVGWGYYGANITNCAAVNDIECDATVKYSGAGGILGGYGSNGAAQTEITNCYSGGTIKVSGTMASDAVVGGIAGIDVSSNHALVKNCYTYVDMSKCAKAKVSVISSSENTDNENNYYLNDSVRIPAWVHKQGEAKTYDELKGLAITGFVAADESYVPTNAKGGASVGKGTEKMSENFPFPALEFNGKKVHYGDWPAKNTTPSASSYPWENGKIGVILGYSSSGSSFGASSDVVAQMFNNDHTSAGMLGSTSNSNINNYIGLVIGENANGLDKDLRNHLRVLYYSSGGKYKIDGTKLTINDKCTAIYSCSTDKEVTEFMNKTSFSGYKLYGAAAGTNIANNGEALLVLVYDSGVDKDTLNISMENIIGWVKVSDLNDKRNSSSGDPANPDGPEIFDEPVTGPSFDEPATDPEPTDPTEQPTEPTEEPTEPTEQPTEPTEQPTEPTEPTESAPEPTPEEAALPPKPPKTDPAEEQSEPTGSGPDPETQGGGA